MPHRIAKLITKLNINTIIRVVLIALVVFLPILFNPFGFDVFALARVFFLYFFIFIILFLFFIKFWYENKVELIYTYLHLIFLFFLGFIVVSVFFASDKYTALWGYVWDYEGLFSFLSYFIIFYVGFLVFRKTEHIRQLFKYLSFPLLLVSLYAIFQYLFDWQLMDWMQQTEIRRATSFLGHPSYLGIYLLLLIPNIYYLARDVSIHKYWRLFYVFCSLLALVSLLLSFSRGAWVAFAALIFISLLFNIKLIRKIINTHSKITVGLVILILLFSILFFFGFIANGFLSLIGQRLMSIVDPTSATTQVRSVLYRQSLLLLKDNWLLGIGPDNFTYVVPQYFLKYWYIFRAMVADKAHNQILDYWISFGLGGIISYLTFLFFFFRTLFKVKGKMILSDKRLIEGLLLSIVAYLVAVQFHYSTIDLAPLFWLFVGAGLGIVAKNKLIKEHRIVFNNKTFYWPIFLRLSFIFIFIFFLLLNIIFYNKLSADYCFARGMQGNEDIKKSISYLEQATNNNPRVSNYFLALNVLYLQFGKSQDDNVYLQKAVDSLILGIKHIPLDYRLHYQLGDTYMNIVDYARNKNFIYEQSQKAYEESLRLYPAFVDAHLKLGVSSAHLGEDKRALNSWLKCIKLDEQQEQCYYNLYTLLEKRGDNELAAKYYRRYLSLSLK